MKFISPLLLLLSFLSAAQSWESLPNFPGDPRDDAIAFSIGEFGYCVTGKTDNNANTNALYMYDPKHESWQQKSSFPGVSRQYTSVFTYKNKAYLIGGYSTNGDGLKDVWSYDALADSWTQMADFPDSARWSAIAFQSGDFGYFGLGETFDGRRKDFWQYNPVKDEWKQLADFPGGARRDAIGVAINGYGYVGLGLNDFNEAGHFSDLYRFNTLTLTWEDNTIIYPGGKRSYAFADKMGTQLIIGGGMNGSQIFQSDCYSFNTLNNSWEELDTLLTGPIRGSSNFVLNNRLYSCTGLLGNFTRSNHFHKLSFPKVELTVYPNPANSILYFTTNHENFPSEIKIFNLQGELIYSNILTDTFIPLPPLNSGLYLFHFLHDGVLISRHKIILE